MDGRLYVFQPVSMDAVDQWGLAAIRDATVLELIEVIDGDIGEFTWHNGYESVDGVEVRAGGRVFREYRNTVDYVGGKSWREVDRVGVIVRDRSLVADRDRYLVNGKPARAANVLAISATPSFT